MNTEDALKGLYPLPEGSLVCYSDPYEKKTVRFVRASDMGDKHVAPPSDYAPPAGYKVLLP